MVAYKLKGAQKFWRFGVQQKTDRVILGNKFAYL